MPHQSLQRTQDEIQKILADARAKSMRRWVPGAQDDAAAIEQARVHFDSSLIPPEQGAVEVEPHIAQVLQIDHGAIRVWFLTCLQTQRVFFDERTGLFGVAWGPDSSTGNYVDLGLRTDDPLDAFLA
jgi:hypothetical protein